MTWWGVKHPSALNRRAMDGLVWSPSSTTWTQPPREGSGWVTIFELVKLALDELYSEAEQSYGDKVDEKIQAKIAYLTDSYVNLTDAGRKPVDYKDPATRFAY